MKPPYALAAWSLVDAISAGWSPPYAVVPDNKDWPRTRASLQLAMQHSRIDALSDDQFAARVRLGWKL